MRNPGQDPTVVARLIRRLGSRRVPVLLQMTSTECGAACLAMILSFLGRKTTVSDCHEFLGSGRDGLTAHMLAVGARRYGLRVRAYSLEPFAMAHLKLPAIAHWNFNHFVVVERWSPRCVDIVDPASGRRRITPEEFDASFTGVLLEFEPTDDFKRANAAGRPAFDGYFRKMLQTRGVRGVLFQVLAVSLLLQVLGLIMPLFTKVVIDQVLPTQGKRMLPILGLGMGIMVLAQSVASYLRSTLLISLAVRLDSKMMLGLFEHVLSLPFQFFQQRTSGDLLMRLGSNTVIREMLSNQTVSAILDAAFVVVYLLVLLALAPLYGVVVLAIACCYAVFVVLTSRRIHELVARDLAASSGSQSYLVEALMGIATLKASGGEESALRHWSNLFFKSLNVSQQRKQFSAAVDTAMVLLRTFCPLVLLWIGATQVLSGAMSIGSMLAFSTLALYVVSPLASLAATAQQLQIVGAHLDRIMDIAGAEREQNLDGVQLAPRLTGKVELHNVAFRYDSNSPWVLRGISVTIKPGQTVALVGRSGSGKSTLARLLLGLYAPTEGSVLYDDIPMQMMNYRSVRRQLGVVLQESGLFSGSIRQNIAFNHPDVPLDSVMEAARLAAIHDEIQNMPMGYETRLNEGGSGLSGGQCQRVALARALARRPAVLILDEATSSLDVMTERHVQQNLDNLVCTRIVIAHRLSTIRNADLIIVMDQGAVIERGSHEELLESGGLYAELVSSQLAAQPAA
jgi:ATP-binding cassette subfamily B protein